ncbi:MAG TPA: AMP-binding protein, partial [Pseudonocardia sp.]
MSVYTERPWLARYADGLPADIKTEYGTLLEMFAASVARAPDTEAIRYFDGVLTMADLDAASDALAVGLAGQGFQPGDRLAVYVQNNPAFVVGLLGAWKAGGAAVAINPMNKARELTYLLTDSGATALLCLEELYESVAKGVIETGETQVRSVITASPLDWQTRNDPRLFADARKTRHDGTLDLLELIEGNAGRKPDAPAPKPDDIGILTYTSGTTGVPKGAMNTHATMSFNAQTYREWMKLTGEDSVLGVAPLFHITGLIGHVALALLLPCPLVLGHRFHPEATMDLIREHRPTFTVGAITVFISLAGIDGVTKDDFASFKMLYSG